MKKITLLFLAIISSHMLPSHANAQPPANTSNYQSIYTEAYKACMIKNNRIVPDMVRCVQSEYKLWDKRLNTYWRSFIAEPGAVKKDAEFPEYWVLAQKSWIKYRDAQCQVSSISMSDEAIELWVLHCKTNMTIERIKQLQDPNWPSPPLSFYLP